MIGSSASQWNTKMSLAICEQFGDEEQHRGSVLTIWVYRDLIISGAAWNVMLYININETK